MVGCCLPDYQALGLGWMLSASFSISPTLSSPLGSVLSAQHPSSSAEDRVLSWAAERCLLQFLRLRRYTDFHQPRLILKLALGKVVLFSLEIRAKIVSWFFYQLQNNRMATSSTVARSFRGTNDLFTTVLD